MSQLDQYEPQLKKKVRQEEHDEPEEEPEEPFDEHTLKHLLARLDHHIAANADLRLKYKDQPERFVDSEIDLDEDIKLMQNLCAYPDLYPLFSNSHSVGALIQLLQHQNFDIVLEVVNFFKELVQLDNQSDAKTLLQLYDSLINNYFFESLFDCMKRTTDRSQDEINCLYNCFEIVETMIEVRPAYCDEVCKRTLLIPFLLQKIEDDSQALDDNRLYASELIVELLSQSEANQKQLGRIGGIENLLVTIAKYRKVDPETAEEKEIACNICDALTLVLLHRDNQDSFNSFEGLQLAMKLVQSKRMLALHAYKLMLSAINQNQVNCKHLVEIGVLSLVFPILMRKGLKYEQADKQKELDEASVGIIKQLFRWCDEAQLKRLSDKCNEKLENIIDLRSEYIELIPLIDPEEYDQLKEEQLEAVYLDLLSQGLLVVESCDIILLECKRRGIEVPVEIPDMVASLMQMIKYIDDPSDKEYYTQLHDSIINK